MTIKIRIATRESKLALWQAHYVQDRISETHPGIKTEIIGMTTQGDRDKRSPLSRIGGKGVFVKELEQALLMGEADIAVHSMKDVPSVLPGGLSIQAICERADPRDAFVSRKYQRIEEVPSGGRIGSSSLRRRLQLKSRYPDLQYLELRGNVGTRLEKLDEGEFEGIILAAAGLGRLGLQQRISEHLSPAYCIPSAGQGAVGIESRIDDSRVNDVLHKISHPETEFCVSCERLITARLGANCNLPIAVFAEIEDGLMHLSSFVSDGDGKKIINVRLSGPVEEGKQLAEQVAGELLDRGAGELIGAQNTDFV